MNEISRVIKSLQCASTAYLFCVLSHGFSRKRESACSLGWCQFLHVFQCLLILILNLRAISNIIIIIIIIIIINIISLSQEPITDPVKNIASH